MCTPKCNRHPNLNLKHTRTYFALLKVCRPEWILYFYPRSLICSASPNGADDSGSFCVQRKESMGPTLFSRAWMAQCRDGSDVKAHFSFWTLLSENVIMADSDTHIKFWCAIFPWDWISRWLSFWSVIKELPQQGQIQDVFVSEIYFTSPPPPALSTVICWQVPQAQGVWSTKHF